MVVLPCDSLTSESSKCHSLLSGKVSCKCNSNKDVGERVIGPAPEISSSGKSSEMLCLCDSGEFPKMPVW